MGYKLPATETSDFLCGGQKRVTSKTIEFYELIPHADLSVASRMQADVNYSSHQHAGMS